MMPSPLWRGWSRGRTRGRPLARAEDEAEPDDGVSIVDRSLEDDAAFWSAATASSMPAGDVALDSAAHALGREGGGDDALTIRAFRFAAQPDEVSVNFGRGKSDRDGAEARRARRAARLAWRSEGGAVSEAPRVRRVSKVASAARRERRARERDGREERRERGARSWWAPGVEPDLPTRSLLSVLAPTESRFKRG